MSYDSVHEKAGVTNTSTTSAAATAPQGDQAPFTVQVNGPSPDVGGQNSDGPPAAPEAVHVIALDGPAGATGQDAIYRELLRGHEATLAQTKRVVDEFGLNDHLRRSLALGIRQFAMAAVSLIADGLESLTPARPDVERLEVESASLFEEIWYDTKASVLVQKWGELARVLAAAASEADDSAQLEMHVRRANYLFARASDYCLSAQRELAVQAKAAAALSYLHCDLAARTVGSLLDHGRQQLTRLIEQASSALHQLHGDLHAHTFRAELRELQAARVSRKAYAGADGAAAADTL